MTTAAADGVGFLVHTRAVLREHYGPDLVSHADRVATIIAAAVPLLAAYVKNGRINIGLAEELCRLPSTAQLEVLSHAGIKEIRRFATSLRHLRLSGPSPRCLCCGHRVEPRVD